MMIYKLLQTTFILSLMLAPSFSHAKVIEKIHAVVNGETITLTEINGYQHKLKTGGFLNDLLFSDPKERSKALKDKDYLLKLLVDEKIIDYEVKQNGFLITEERVDKEVETIASRQNMSVSQMKAALKVKGIRYKDYRNFIKQSIERRQLVDKEITSKIKISEQDIVSHYLAKNNTNKTQVFEYRLSHILFNSNDSSKADKVAKNIQGGQSFVEMVKKHSIDDDSKSNSGIFGDFKSGEMIGSIQSAIDDLQIGQSTSVVKTPMGLHIFKVVDKKLVKDPKIESQKQAIYQQLFAQAFKEQLSFWLIQKRKDAIIQFNKS